MTKRYAKMNESRLREGAEAIEKALTVDNKEIEAPAQIVNFTK
jgi:hypothetical protein